MLLFLLQVPFSVERFLYITTRADSQIITPSDGKLSAFAEGLQLGVEFYLSAAFWY